MSRAAFDSIKLGEDDPFDGSEDDSDVLDMMAPKRAKTSETTQIGSSPQRATFATEKEKKEKEEEEKSDNFVVPDSEEDFGFESEEEEGFAGAHDKFDAGDADSEELRAQDKDFFSSDDDDDDDDDGEDILYEDDDDDAPTKTKKRKGNKSVKRKSGRRPFTGVYDPCYDEDTDSFVALLAPLVPLPKGYICAMQVNAKLVDLASDSSPTGKRFAEQEKFVRREEVHTCGIDPMNLKEIGALDRCKEMGEKGKEKLEIVNEKTNSWRTAMAKKSKRKEEGPAFLIAYVACSGTARDVLSGIFGFHAMRVKVAKVRLAGLDVRPALCDVMFRQECTTPLPMSTYEISRYTLVTSMGAYRKKPCLGGLPLLTNCALTMDALSACEISVPEEELPNGAVIDRILLPHTALMPPFETAAFPVEGAAAAQLPAANRVHKGGSNAEEDDGLWDFSEKEEREEVEAAPVVPEQVAHNHAAQVAFADAMLDTANTLVPFFVVPREDFESKCYRSLAAFTLPDMRESKKVYDRRRTLFFGRNDCLLDQRHVRLFAPVSLSFILLGGFESNESAERVNNLDQIALFAGEYLIPKGVRHSLSSNCLTSHFGVTCATAKPEETDTEKNYDWSFLKMAARNSTLYMGRKFQDKRMHLTNLDYKSPKDLTTQRLQSLSKTSDPLNDLAHKHVIRGDDSGTVVYASDVQTDRVGAPDDQLLRISTFFSSMDAFPHSVAALAKLVSFDFAICAFNNKIAEKLLYAITGPAPADAILVYNWRSWLGGCGTLSCANAPADERVRFGDEYNPLRGAMEAAFMQRGEKSERLVESFMRFCRIVLARSRGEDIMLAAAKNISTFKLGIAKQCLRFYREKADELRVLRSATTRAPELFFMPVHEDAPRICYPHARVPTAFANIDFRSDVIGFDVPDNLIGCVPFDVYDEACAVGQLLSPKLRLFKSGVTAVRAQTAGAVFVAYLKCIYKCVHERGHDALVLCRTPPEKLMLSSMLVDDKHFTKEEVEAHVHFVVLDKSGILPSEWLRKRNESDAEHPLELFVPLTHTLERKQIVNALFCLTFYGSAAITFRMHQERASNVDGGVLAEFQNVLIDFCSIEDASRRASAHRKHALFWLYAAMRGWPTARDLSGADERLADMRKDAIAPVALFIAGVAHRPRPLSHPTRDLARSANLIDDIFFALDFSRDTAQLDQYKGALASDGESYVRALYDDKSLLQEFRPIEREYYERGKHSSLRDLNKTEVRDVCVRTHSALTTSSGDDCIMAHFAQIAFVDLEEQDFVEMTFHDLAEETQIQYENTLLCGGRNLLFTARKSEKSILAGAAKRGLLRSFHRAMENSPVIIELTDLASEANHKAAHRQPINERERRRLAAFVIVDVDANGPEAFVERAALDDSVDSTKLTLGGVKETLTERKLEEGFPLSLILGLHAFPAPYFTYVRGTFNDLIANKIGDNYQRVNNKLRTRLEHTRESGNSDANLSWFWAYETCIRSPVPFMLAARLKAEQSD